MFRESFMQEAGNVWEQQAVNGHNSSFLSAQLIDMASRSNLRKTSRRL